MKILLVENSGAAAYQLIELLEESKHEVFLAADCTMAQDFWDEEGIDCLIIDLNMEPRGLKEDEITQTQGGLFTGWVWLRNYVFSQDETMVKKTLILTAYEKDFRERIPAEERAGVKVVSKGTGQGNVYEEILSFVNAIDNELKKQG